MRFSQTDKKELLIFFITTYGVTYIMGLFMWKGYTQGKDVTSFVNAQMLYPAAGVMTAYLITRKADRNLPKRFFISYFAAVLIMIICAIMSILPGCQGLQGTTSLLLMGGSLVCGGLMLYEEYEKRRVYGLTWKKGKTNLFCIFLFTLLFLGRAVILYIMSGTLAEAAQMAANPETWFWIMNILIQFFICFLPFFGEEYGWRYFLQPQLQKRFGKRMGTVFVGMLWGIWHLPVNYFFYSPGNGLMSQAVQQITCITMGIFLAYAYMKTENIWVPVILHYLNNSLILIVSGKFTEKVTTNQNVSWEMLPQLLLIYGILFGSFILAKEFRKEK